MKITIPHPKRLWLNLKCRHSLCDDSRLVVLHRRGLLILYLGCEACGKIYMETSYGRSMSDADELEKAIKIDRTRREFNESMNRLLGGWQLPS